MICSPRFFVFVASTAWASAVAFPPPAQAQSADAGVLEGVIESFQENTLAVRHRPTGHVMKLRVPDSAKVTRWVQVDLDELPDGHVLQSWGRPDEAAGSFRSNILHALPDRPDLALGVKGTTIVARLARRPFEADPSLASRDGKESLFLSTGDRLWQLAVKKGSRPNVFRTESGSAADFQPKREIELTYRGSPQDAELTTARVSILFPPGLPYYMNPPGGPTGMTLDTLEDSVAKVRANHEGIAADLARRMPVRIEVVPELARVDEPVTVRLAALADRTPQATLEFFPGYLQNARSDRRELTIPWKKTGEKRHGLDVFTAEVALPELAVGQHLIGWKSNIGGDIEQFWRSFGVVDDATSICLFQVNNLPPDLLEVFQKHLVPFCQWNHLPLDFKRWTGPNPSAEKWADASRLERQFGFRGEFGLLYYPWGAGQVREDSPELQAAGLRALQTIAPLLGYTKPVTSFWNYTMGNDTVRLARELGYQSVTAICTENHIDGNMAINHTGRPERPYFLAPDDFRKAGPGGETGMVGFSQVQRHTILARRFLCDYNFEPGNGGIHVGSGGREVWDEIAFSRLFDFYESFFQLQASQRVPFVIQQCLEFSGQRVGAAEGNRLMVDYAVRKVREGGVVISTSRAVADFYRRHYKETPETVAYFHDYWAGFAGWQKPVHFPDVAQIENARFTALFLQDSLLPEYHYDYTKPWDYPDFGNENLPRKRDGFGYPDPENYDRFAWTPSTTDTRAMSAQREDTDSAKALMVKVTVRSDAARPQFPIALWNLPRTWQPGEGWYQAEDGARFVPLKAPFTENLNGFLIADLKEGENTFSLRISSPPRAPRTLDIAKGDLRAKVFERDGRNMAYVYPAKPWPVTFRLTVPEDKSVEYYAAPEGVRVDLAPGTHTLTIAKDTWARLIGLTHSELASALDNP